MLKTVAILFFGNYIFGDENEKKFSKFLIDNITKLGFKIEKVSYLIDVEKVLTVELFSCSRQYDLVIVTGDLNSKNLFKSLRNLSRYGLKSNSKSPTNGYDHYERTLLQTVVKEISSSPRVVYFHRIFFVDEGNVEESYRQVLMKSLERLRKKLRFSKKFIGPTIAETDFKNLNFVTVLDENTIQLEGDNFDLFVKNEKMLKENLGTISKICDNSFNFEDIRNSSERHVLEAIVAIEKCFETYGIENVFLSFNGGKDCTVLLHLIYTVLKIKYPEHNVPIFCMYVKNKHTFDEQEEFVDQCKIYYNLEIESSLLNMKEALDEVLRKKPNLKACFIGTRRTDPYSSNLNVFQMTDPSWPKVMRVSPLLDWHYSDIWDYLLFNKVPYCKLYDMGYTSLGSASNTIKNPGLSFHNAIEDIEEFLPAYKLLNEAEERNGRNVLKNAIGC